MATLLGLVPPFIGPLVYLLLPSAGVPRGRARARARDPGDGGAARRGASRTARCAAPTVEPEFLVCPVCTTSCKPGVRRPASSRSSRSGRCARTARRRSCAARRSSRRRWRSRPRSSHEPLRTPRAPPPRDAPSEDTAENADRRSVDCRAPWRSSGHWCWSSRTRSGAGSRARSSRASSARGLTMRAGEAADGLARARGGALRGAQREAVLRRAGRVHHLVADARAGARGRGRDRGRALDDGLDEPGRLGARGRSAATSRSSMPDNLVHGSDSPESAAREVALWFADDELV